MEISAENKIKLYHGLKITLIAFLVAIFVNGWFGEPRSKYDNTQENVITFSGHGEVTATPDIANIYFTINKESKTVKEAQTLVAEIEKKSLDFLKENNVLEKDIKTTNASFIPKYEYQYDAKAILRPCTEYSCPPRPGKNVIVGYSASESITVKIRNTDDVGKIIQGLGILGVSDLNGPDFSIDKENELKAQARKLAIDDAKQKAKDLAEDLDIRLGDIISFSEGINYGGMYYKATIMDSMESATPAPAEIPKGENTITSDVNITYEIR